MPQSRIWLVSTPSPEVDALKNSIHSRIEIAHKEGLPQDLRKCLLLWIHAAPGQDEPQIGKEELRRIRDFVEQGGRLLLTGSVAALLGPLGVESNPPTPKVLVWEKTSLDEDRLGVACFLSHPLFSRFPGGVFLRRPYPGCRIGGAFYQDGDSPKDGRLLGVERRGRALGNGILVEHCPGKGRILSLGAHLVFDEEGPSRFFLEERLRFTGDMVDYLCSAGSQCEGLSWPTREVKGLEPKAGLVPIVFPEPAPVGESFPGDSFEFPQDGSEREAKGGKFTLVTSEGSVLLGDGEQGVCEVWGLPLRFLKSFVILGKGTVPGDAITFGAWPNGVQRLLGETMGESFVELWGKAGPRSFVGRLENPGKEERRFGLSFIVDLQLPAPYPKNVLGLSELCFEKKGRSFEWTDAVLGFCARLDFSMGFEEVEVEGASSHSSEYAVRLSGALDSGKALEWRLSLGMSVEDARQAQKEIASFCTKELIEKEEKDFQSWLGQRFRLELGKSEEGGKKTNWLWAKARELCLKIPKGPHGPSRKAFMTRLSRGGEGGFYGKEGLWIARALLPCGAFEDVRAQLELFAENQGPSGEILEWLSPAGIREFGSSDATALFVVLLGSYTAWTGDLEFAERLFPTLRRALASLNELDRDGDGISENNGLGPGWVTEGPLREGIVAEVSQVAIQASAFDAAASLCLSLDIPGQGVEWRQQARLLREHLAKRFFDEESGWFALGLKRDGSFDRRESALALFPLLFGQAGRSEGAAVLARLEKASFATPGGLRLLSRSDPDFDPGSEMSGKPLVQLGFCLALAEILYGKGEKGSRRWVQLWETLSGGDPVAEGKELALAQALGSAAEGLLGAHVRPDGQSLGLRVILPPEEDSLQFKGLRFRNLFLAGEVTRSPDGQSLDFHLEVAGEGEEILSLGLWIPETQQLQEVHEGEVLCSTLLEKGLEGDFAVLPDRSLQPGDRSTWVFRLRRSLDAPEPPISQAVSKEPVHPQPSLKGKQEIGSQKPLKIAHLCHGYPPEFHGGTEHYVQALALAQKEKGDEPIVIAGRGDAGSGILCEEIEGIPVFRLGKDILFHERWYHGFSPQILEELLQILLEQKVDIVHIHHWMRLSFDMGAWVRAMGLPTIMTLHDLSTTCPRALRIRRDQKFCEEDLNEAICLPCAPRESWMRNEDLNFLLDWFSFAQERELRVGGALLAPSKAQSDFLRERMGTDLEIQVVPHGSLPSMQLLQNAPRPEVRQEDRQLRLAYWGHIQPLKGVHVLLDAASRLKDPGRVKILLWGDADDPFYASRIEELGRNLDLEWRKSFRPEELVDLKADLAVFPSLAHETWSFVLSEAFAKGLPVLCSDRGALPERVGCGGVTFRAGDPDDLAAKIEELVDNPGLLENFRQHLPAPFPMEEHADVLREIYCSLFSESLSPKELSEMRKETTALLEDLKRWEENTRRYEERCRELAGLREKAESERGHLEDDLKEALASVEEYRERLAVEGSRIQEFIVQREEQKKDLENHKVLVGDLRRDLEAHKKELERARDDFRKTEAYLIENKKTLEERDAQLLLASQEAEKAKNEVEEGKKRIQALEDNLEELRASLQELRENLAVCQESLDTSTRRMQKLQRENRFAFILTFPAKLLFRLWDRIRGQ